MALQRKCIHRPVTFVQVLLVISIQLLKMVARKFEGAYIPGCVDFFLMYLQMLFLKIQCFIITVLKFKVKGQINKLASGYYPHLFPGTKRWLELIQGVVWVPGHVQTSECQPVSPVLHPKIKNII